MHSGGIIGPWQARQKTGRLARIRDMDSMDRRMLVRAAWHLLVARLVLVFVPFRRVTGKLSSARLENPRSPDPELVRRIGGLAVARAASHVPWRSDCFPQTIAARSLLNREGFGSTIHIGVEREGEDQLNGHAWLTCGHDVVTGGSGLDRYTELHRIEC